MYLIKKISIMIVYIYVFNVRNENVGAAVLAMSCVFLLMLDFNSRYQLQNRQIT